MATLAELLKYHNKPSGNVNTITLNSDQVVALLENSPLPSEKEYRDVLLQLARFVEKFRDAMLKNPAFSDLYDTLKNPEQLVLAKPDFSHFAPMIKYMSPEDREKHLDNTELLDLIKINRVDLDSLEDLPRQLQYIGDQTKDEKLKKFSERSSDYLENEILSVQQFINLEEKNERRRLYIKKPFNPLPDVTVEDEEVAQKNQQEVIKRLDLENLSDVQQYYDAIVTKRTKSTDSKTQKTCDWFLRYFEAEYPTIKAETDRGVEMSKTLLDLYHVLTNPNENDLKEFDKGYLFTDIKQKANAELSSSDSKEEHYQSFLNAAAKDPDAIAAAFNILHRVLKSDSQPFELNAQDTKGLAFLLENDGYTAAVKKMLSEKLSQTVIDYLFMQAINKRNLAILKEIQGMSGKNRPSNNTVNLAFLIATQSEDTILIETCLTVGSPEVIGKMLEQTIKNSNETVVEQILTFIDQQKEIDPPLLKHIGWALANAAEKGQDKTVEKFLSMNGINSVDSNYFKSAFTAARQKNHIETVNLLLSMPDKLPNGLLDEQFYMEEVNIKRPEIANSILAMAGDYLDSGLYIMYALNLAVETGQIEMAEKILTKKIDKLDKADMLNTLKLAAKHNRTEVVETLLNMANNNSKQGFDLAYVVREAERNSDLMQVIENMQPVKSFLEMRTEKSTTPAPNNSFKTDTSSNELERGPDDQPRITEGGENTTNTDNNSDSSTRIQTSSTVFESQKISVEKDHKSDEPRLGFDANEQKKIREALTKSANSVSFIGGWNNSGTKSKELNDMKNKILFTLNSGEYTRQGIIKDLEEFAKKANEYRRTSKTTTSFSVFKANIGEVLDKGKMEELENPGERTEYKPKTPGPG